MLIDELVRFAESLDDRWHSPVADAAAEFWDLQRPVFIRSSASHVFVARAVKGDGPRVVLRIRPNSGDAAVVLERGARAARGWLGAGAPFVDSVASAAGHFVEQVDGYVVTALMAAEGNTLEESGVDAAAASQWGETLARLHSAEATFLPPDLPAAEEFITNDIGPELATVADTVLEALVELPRCPRARGVLHGDAEPDNVVATSEGMVLVDPDEVRVGWFVSDIAFALRDWGDTTGRIDWTCGVPAAFLEGYQAVRPINHRQQLDWLPLLVRAAAFEELSALQPHLQSPAQPKWPTWATALDAKIRARAASLHTTLLS